MSSSAPRELDDLEAGLPVTPRDVAIQKRLRQAPGPVSTEEYLRFLASLPVAPESPASRRKLPRGFSLFDLLD